MGKGKKHQMKETSEVSFTFVAALVVKWKWVHQLIKFSKCAFKTIDFFPLMLQFVCLYTFWDRKAMCQMHDVLCRYFLEVTRNRFQLIVYCTVATWLMSVAKGLLLRIAKQNRACCNCLRYDAEVWCTPPTIINKAKNLNVDERRDSNSAPCHRDLAHLWYLSPFHLRW